MENKYWYNSFVDFLILIIISLIIQSIPFGNHKIAVGATRAVLIGLTFVLLKTGIAFAFPNEQENENQGDEIE